MAVPPVAELAVAAVALVHPGVEEQVLLHAVELATGSAVIQTPSLYYVSIHTKYSEGRLKFSLMAAPPMAVRTCASNGAESATCLRARASK